MYLLFLLAVLPPIAMLAFVYYQDKTEKEPLRMLLFALFLGGLSCFPAIIFELLGGSILSAVTPQTLFPIVDNFIGVALIEEGCKFILIYAYIYNHKDFDYTFDGIVYSVTISLGFALVENIFYVFENGLITGILRSVTSIPGHTIFAIFMGIFIAKAKTSKTAFNKMGERNAFFLALLVPTLIHGAYDLLAETNFFSFLIFIVAMDIVSIMQLRYYQKKDTLI